MLSNKETKMFVCVKCEKSYASKRALNNHNEKRPFCNMVAPVVPATTNNNEIVELKGIIMVLVEEIRSLREEFKSFKSQSNLQISTNPTPISTNITPVITPDLSPIVVVAPQKTNELTEEDKYIYTHPTLDESDIRRIKKIGVRRFLSIDNAIEEERIMNIELDNVARDKEFADLLYSRQQEREQQEQQEREQQSQAQEQQEQEYTMVHSVPIVVKEQEQQEPIVVKEQEQDKQELPKKKKTKKIKIPTEVDNPVVPFVPVKPFVPFVPFVPNTQSARDFFKKKE